MRLLLDTHVWIRWIAKGQPLDVSTVKMIEKAEFLAVSAISCWEVAYLVKNGRLVLPNPLDRWMVSALSGSGVGVIDISSEIAVASALLPDVHRDPADRLIIATALRSKCMLATFDASIKQYDALKNCLIC